MDKYTATEQAYKNGYEQGKKDAVRHGRWEHKKHKLFGNEYDYICSTCGCDYALAQYRYCPNCGAKMDLEGKR